MANLNTSTIAALNGAVTASPLDNFGTAGVIITGTWVGTITFQGSLDGTNFVNILAQNLSTNALVTTTTANGQFVINTSGMSAIKVVMTAYTSGTANISIQANGSTSITRSLSTLSGGTDGTNIGNVSDSLKVTIGSSTGAGGTPLAYSKKLRYIDMNASNGGVARGTSITEAAGWVDVFAYTGSGLLTGFNMTIATANSGWLIRLVVDGEELFSSNGILTTDVNGVYGLTVGTQNQTSQGLNMAVDAGAFYFTAPAYYPINYSTSISVKVKRATGAGTKVFSGGLLALTKET